MTTRHEITICWGPRCPTVKQRNALKRVVSAAGGLVFLRPSSADKVAARIVQLEGVAYVDINKVTRKFVTRHKKGTDGKFKRFRRA